MSGVRKPTNPNRSASRIPRLPLPAMPPRNVPPVKPRTANTALPARKLVGESVRPTPAPMSLRLTLSTDMRGLSFSTAWARPIFMGSTARSRKLS